MSNNVTIFKNIKETQAPFHLPIGVILDRIKDGKSKELVKSIRAEKDKNRRAELKQQLPAVCFSGTFNKRNDKSILEHSGLICLDFDDYEKKSIMKEHKDKIAKDKYVYSVFVSPSGNGLKVLIKIPADIDKHVNYFNSLEEYFDSPYFDTTSKNISRVCYESWDNLIHINENSEVYDKIKEKEYVEVDVLSNIATLPITDENKIVEILVKWWEKKFPMHEGMRNQNAYTLAMAFNEYGINKSLASYVLNQYEQEDFNLKEIQATIENAYNHTAKFRTKFYEDESAVNIVRLKVRNGATKKEIIEELDSNNKSYPECDVESVIKRVDNEGANVKFWSKSEKGVIRNIPVLFKQFLEDNGFYKYSPEGTANFVFVRVIENLIDHTSDKEIKDFILNHLLQLDDLSVYNHYADRTSLFKEDFLTLLSTIDIHFVRDTKDTSFLYYSNCAVKVTTNDIETIDYVDLDGYVWKDHVIDRTFRMCRNYDCDYKTFISRICGGSQDRIDTVESTIGFMLHGYKNLSSCPAIILNDEVASENPEGGTGKGIFMNALSHMKKLVVIDGKAFNFEKSFPYQTVSVDTQLLCFDDVKRNFDFERLFSVITEGLTLEKKNKDAIKIPYTRSPKVAITTNYAIRGTGNSFARRKFEIELHPHYSKQYTPFDEFKKHLFNDWDSDEWCLFDSYMVNCLSSYMRTGLIESELVNGKYKAFILETSEDFVEWCGVKSGEKNPLLPVEETIHLNKLYIDFCDDYPDYGKTGNIKLSRMKFHKFVKAYAKYTTGNDVEEGKDVTGKWYMIKL